MSNIPINCPACNYKLEWSDTGVHLLCKNEFCISKNEKRIMHFFYTIDNIDGFGPKVIENLIKHGFNTISKIYNMKYNDFLYCGYKYKTIMNLGTELEESKKRPIDNYRFIAALGIEHFGIGNAKKFCNCFNHKDIFHINHTELLKIEGFGDTISYEIVKEINKRYNEIEDIFNIGFDIVVQSSHENKESPILGKRICFTGKSSLPRKQMQKQAEELGALIVSGVNSKTDILVCGEKVGANKTNAAEKHNVKVIKEVDYFQLIKNYT